MAKKKPVSTRIQNATSTDASAPDVLGKLREKLMSPLFMLGLIPILVFPWMINVRIFPFIAPNEEPKWMILTLCGVLLGLLSGYFLWKRQGDCNVHFSLSGLLLLLFYALLAIGVFVGPNTTEGMIRFAFWVACLAVWLSVSFAVREKPVFKLWLVWLVSIGSLVFSLRYWWSYILDFSKPGYNISVLFSPIGHVNFTGDVLVILLPALVWMLMTQHHLVLRVFNWVSVWTIMTVLLVASSRGPLGGVFLSALTVGVLVLKHHRSLWFPFREKLKLHLLSLALAVTALGSAGITYYELDYHYRDLARVSGTLQGNAGEGITQLTAGVEQPPFAETWASLSPVLGVRTPMFASSMAMAMDAPLLGQGTGNFFTVYPGYSNRYPDFRDPLSSSRTFTTNPHNFVLQLATQNGFAATIIFVGLLTFFTISLFRAAWIRWDGWMATGSGVMLGVSFDAMFNHIFFNPASMFVFALLGGAWWGMLKWRQAQQVEAIVSESESKGLLIKFPEKAVKIIGGSLIAATLLLAIWPTRWVISEWYAGYAMTYMRQPDVAEMYNQKAYAWDAYNFRAVFGVAQAAYQKQQYQQCADYLIHFEAIYPYNPPALNMLGAAYLSMGHTQEAIGAFERAIKILPDFDMALQNLARSKAILQQQQQQQQQQQASKQAAQSGNFGVPVFPPK